MNMIRNERINENLNLVKTELLLRIMNLMLLIAIVATSLTTFVFANQSDEQAINSVVNSNKETKTELESQFDKKLVKVNGMIKESNNLNDSAESIIKKQEILDYKYSEIPLNNSLKNKVFKECKRFNIDPDIVYGLFYCESRFDPNEASSISSARGLGQFLGSTAKYCYKALGYKGEYNHDYAFNPELNIEMTCFYLRYLQDTYHVGIRKALYFYNGCQTYYYADMVQNYAQKLKNRASNFVSK